ncbi:tail fiber domain-containing protein [Vibrio owensii]|uniref:tail fiber domain-containing protein n=1 Tax=Vibrio owensii TaxID=696485 RepID=UPI004069829E
MNIGKWQAIAQEAHKPQLKFGLGGGSSSSGGSSSGSGSSSGQSWILDVIGDDLAGIMGGMIGNIGDMPTFTSPDYDAAMGGIQTIGSYYFDQLTADSSAQMNNVLAAQANQAQANLDSSISSISESANMAGGAGGSRQGVAEGSAVAQANQDLNALQSQTAAAFTAADRQAKQAGAQGLGKTIQAGLGIQGDQARSQFLSELQQTNPEFYQLLMIQAGMGGMAGWGGSSSSDWSSSSSTESKGRGWSLSDKRYKENIFQIGTLSNGLGLYAFSYTVEAQEKLGMPSGAQTGVMAQEVLEVLPEAALESLDGFYVVDYTQVLHDAANKAVPTNEANNASKEGC